MFEWLTETEYEIDFNGQDAYLAEYNPETKMFNVNNEDREKIGEINLFETKITWNLNYYEEWTDKLYTSLIRNNGKIQIQVLSTESADIWLLEIYRHKTLLPTHEYSSNIILTNYVVVFADEIKGKILTREYKRYAGCMIDEKKDFKKWIEEQVDTVSEFNGEGCTNTLSAIILSEGLLSEEEDKLLNEMFREKWYNSEE